ncbi:SDR family NAD(P)-dependent oxidoreductase [Aestuariivirga sp.]|uniref:SDR family NAD(P)-dependent oxidoreductase n=1 Tax=Aestuariivirga sp. TaxID=2650926 RepID=UPI003919F5DB
MVKRLDELRVLITGAANGIGRATAMAFLAAGARVVGLDLNASDGPAKILACDLSREEDVVRAVAAAAGDLGGLDVVVNNAGIMREAPVGAITAADIDAHFAVNVRGAILVTREALPHLKEGARIINLASELAYLGRQNASVYCATKAAMLGLTRSWARELAPGILVNAVAPGPTDTPLLGFESLTPAQRALETAHPLGRIGRPEEVAAAILFLAGPGATLFTGQCLGANGGAAMA